MPIFADVVTYKVAVLTRPDTLAYVNDAPLAVVEPITGGLARFACSCEFELRWRQ